MDSEVRTLLGSINDEFNRLAGVAMGSQSAFQGITFQVGNLARNENDSPPKIVFMVGNGQFDPGKGTGGVKVVSPGSAGPPPIAVIVQRVQIWIWGIDDQACWDMFRLLGPAIRNVAGGPNFKWREYQEPTETDDKWIGLGATLVLTLDLDIALSGQIDGERAERAVLGHTHIVSMLNTVADAGSNPLP